MAQKVSELVQPPPQASNKVFVQPPPQATVRALVHPPQASEMVFVQLPQAMTAELMQPPQATAELLTTVEGLNACTVKATVISATAPASNVSFFMSNSPFKLFDGRTSPRLADTDVDSATLGDAVAFVKRKAAGRRKPGAVTNCRPAKI
jgi:hypothetical protein